MKDQRGVISYLPLLALAGIGLSIYLLISGLAPFKEALFNTLYPKQSSEAATRQTITFDTLRKNRELKGQYPAGLIDWGQGIWFVNAPWGRFKTNNLIFDNNIKGGSFTFLQPRRLVSLEAFNGGGSRTTTIKVSCPGQPDASVEVRAERTATLYTNWNAPCSPVTIYSGNGWNTSFDNLVIDDASSGTVAPTPIPTPTPRQTLSPTPTPIKISPIPTPTPLPNATPTPTPSTNTGSIWKPALVTSWQWQLSTPVDTSLNVQMYDIDLFDNSSSVVQTLHNKGIKVICYISAGTYEDWRPDANQFPASILGKSNGWPGEKWLDVRQWNVLGPIMEARMDKCKQMGFDGIEPDNIDGYSNSTGFSITYQDQLNYNRNLAAAAHARGLSVALKNDVEQVPDLWQNFDWALNEECFDYNECGNYSDYFINNGKAVFQVEYNRNYCSQANALNFNGLVKDLDLTAKRTACR
ncbi:endo alpha-1,4 polygalactosaminidase [Patescibacteria group bacterium]|nr:endo alpha-1,4 polygalactosaminidase [Patescibacteria group bacterium]MCL5409662.1 endo alpha-1,4 polygalactosaminidase [Patescibacteria group bacterium]